MGISNRTSHFRAKFPLGKVPAFEGPNQTVLFESDAIAQFVAESGPNAQQLLGDHAIERASIRQWVCFADHEIMEPVTKLVMWRVGLAPFDAAVEAQSMTTLRRALQCLERCLKDRQWIATDGQPSLADLSLAGALYWAFMQVIDTEMREEFPMVTDWFRNVVAQKEIRSVFQDVTFVDKRQEHS
ncbi:hypothetical protein EYZ11_010870 [Aspergillus tanneri]|uniref:GST C-terminal domain-containing protein n=1 Tax=Aspergillus tanneri TaxID=1220188 RepID=A0A4S3J4K2_9EURO|nr:uncharacterized protein ATNIH1004_002149 [Aspergillus tanneri]KAA8649478.1 hypothetical protein ATNIH1004_002149 [Aspergillus tanneri]THC89685.1 hypothetical protein EYZ11_010870 [Aspergillus tanneri]